MHRAKVVRLGMVAMLAGHIAGLAHMCCLQFMIQSSMQALSMHRGVFTATAGTCQKEVRRRLVEGQNEATTKAVNPAFFLL